MAEPEEKLATPELKVSTAEEAKPELFIAAEGADSDHAGELHRLLHLARPVTCGARWEEMDGENCVRKCWRCGLDVFDLSNGTQQDAERFIVQSKSRSTNKLWRRSDGRYVRGECLSTPLELIPSIVAATQSIFQVIGFPFAWKYAPVAWLILPLGACAWAFAPSLLYLQAHPNYIWLLVAALAWVTFGWREMSKHSGGWSRVSYVIGFYLTGSVALVKPAIQTALWMAIHEATLQSWRSPSAPHKAVTLDDFPGFDPKDEWFSQWYLYLLLIGLFVIFLNAVVPKLRKSGTK
jgi:hypothetical protein